MDPLIKSQLLYRLSYEGFDLPISYRVLEFLQVPNSPPLPPENSEFFPASPLTSPPCIVDTSKLFDADTTLEAYLPRSPTAPTPVLTSYVVFTYTRSRTIDRIQTRVNNQIRISPLRVIGPDGTQYGVITLDEAMNRARDAGLDLVEVAPNERPPVCRIMDFGKYKYEKNKKSGQKTHQTKTKEIRLRPKTGEHDVETKVRQAIGFLKHKDKVQVTVMFKGREMAHVEEGQRVMAHILADLAEYSKLEQPPSQQGKKMIAMLAPK